MTCFVLCGPTEAQLPFLQSARSGFLMWCLMLSDSFSSPCLLPLPRPCHLSPLSPPSFLNKTLKMPVCLRECSVAVKRHHDHSNSYKGKHITVACYHFSGLVMWEVLLSVCCFDWLMNKELAWPIAWEEEGRVREKLWSHQRQMLGILAGKPLSRGDKHINRNGLN